MPFTFHVATLMSSKIAWSRLRCQRLAAGRLAAAEEVVGWLGAVQAQEYHFAKWGLALRTRRASESSVERALEAGRILRTHMMRATWHFVAPADIRWLLALTAPRIRAAVAYYDRQLGITPAVITRANRAIAAALAGGTQLTRAELAPILSKAGVPVNGLRLGHLMMHAELDGVICSGARKGKQFTYALLEERAPQAQTLDHDRALIELTRRYFRSHGPATARDFVWWSGLTARQANKGAALLDGNFIRERIGDQEYILKAQSLKQNKRQMTFLMPDYDEYGISYKNKSSLLAKTEGIDLSKVSPYSHLLIVDGVISGTWTVEPAQSVSVEANPYFSMTRGQQQAIAAAIKRYKIFLEDRNRS